VSFVFSQDVARLVLEGNASATLVPISTGIKAETVRRFRRRIVTHDEDGTMTGTRTEPVTTIRDDERVPLVLTIRDVRTTELSKITATEAKACGFRTANALRDSWRSRHPRQELVKFVRFEVGDNRDRPNLLTASPGSVRYVLVPGPNGHKRWKIADEQASGDYTDSFYRSARDEGEALVRAQYMRLGMAARQAQAKRRAATSVRLAEQPAHVRMATIEAAGERMRLNLATLIRRERYVIETRLQRAERQLGLDDDSLVAA
jgi:hypothetical protein